MLIGKGETVAMVARKLEITEQTYYRWRREYGGLKVDQAKKMKELERENARLKSIVANQAFGMRNGGPASDIAVVPVVDPVTGGAGVTVTVPVR